jgi:alkanesulfonate monooxygenase SsuD/methylene tetrahydromethanopterin reductase-like flavin-dependent oxidoreductase (luciferase family)
MRIGIGLPAAIPAIAGDEVAEWATAAEEHGFASVGVIDRLVYDNIDPVVALSAAAARTERVELLTTVLNVPWRRNAVVLAKQLASVDRLSGGRLTAGLALGGWPDDHAAAGPSTVSLGACMDDMVATMRRVWAGELVGSSRSGAAIPALPPGRPRLLFGGLVPAAFRRAARLGDGWVAPSFGLDALIDGAARVRAAWRDEGRAGEPRVVVERYVHLGPAADEIADHYLEHYYGEQYLAAVRADTPTTVAQLAQELDRLAATGCDDVVLLPCSADIDQVARLAAAVDELRSVVA